MHAREFQRLAGGFYLKGLSVDDDYQCLWFSDVLAGGIGRLHSDRQIARYNPDRLWIGSILLNWDGCILSSGSGGIAWTNPDSGAGGWLLNKIDGHPIGCVNEMTPDRIGGIYFSTVDIGAIARHAQPAPSSIYHLHNNGKLRRLHDGSIFANGLVVSVDRKTLYINETYKGTCAMDIMADGTLGNLRQLSDQHDCDGIALDANDDLWITGFQSGTIRCLSPAGVNKHIIATPLEGVSQIHFAHGSSDTVYLTEVPVDRSSVLKGGRLPNHEVSHLWRCKIAVVGSPVARTQFSLRGNFNSHRETISIPYDLAHHHLNASIVPRILLH
ncbi:SMP-30/gluconolactonase/LRE family protein [Sphingobium sufflavum]|uniref:SMP-30/gluconolactonase/LRE family protein n=1 Tax=Sphingobium sufflavum TaxID=1129547 RepID=UPI001F15968B|nr:SMP-30/gluconolactonase/LRE family protein [Sphingobium sufflavum]MCE7798860.1 SMP-30/gluconolactonase/LRE family protein [Sphingobium sufflavum]